MADRKSGKVIVPSEGGALRSFVQRIKLIARLMGDPRVNVFLKMLPIASVAYWLLPLPLDSAMLVLDDAAVLWIGSTLFVELCPDDVVQEHMRALESNLKDTSEEIVDADATDVNDS
jgi:hypothetical protein